MIGYEHDVDWVAADRKIRRDAQIDFDRFVWGDIPVMILDDPINDAIGNPRVYSPNDRLVAWWRAYLNLPRPLYVDLLESATESRG